MTTHERELVLALRQLLAAYEIVLPGVRSLRDRHVPDPDLLTRAPQDARRILRVMGDTSQQRNLTSNQAFAILSFRVDGDAGSTRLQPGAGTEFDSRTPRWTACKA